MFLYHILKLKEDDLVKKMYEILKDITGSINWSTESQGSRDIYQIEYEDGEIIKVKRET